MHEMYVVTGGAGFIGSNIVAELEERGSDVIVVDSLGNGEKWRNIAKRRLIDIVPPAETFAAIDAIGTKISALIHMGAISDTTEKDADLIAENNFRTSCRLWDWCARRDVPFIYASSAATYGDGSNGFKDQEDGAYFARLRPLNAYGWSKHLFDRWVCHRVACGGPSPPQWAGLKFFNVYGPNEFHKGPQRSVAVQIFDQIASDGRVKLYCSHHPDYKDGHQMRDFIWVGDCVDIVLWMLDQAPQNGLYNIGTAEPRSFLDLAHAVYAAMGKTPDIHYSPMPDELKAKYQYFTQAETSKLTAAGWSKPPLSLEQGVGRYVREYLLSGDPYR